MMDAAKPGQSLYSLRRDADDYRITNNNDGTWTAWFPSSLDGFTLRSVDEIAMLHLLIALWRSTLV